jgi:hypothetical protein
MNETISGNESGPRDRLAVPSLFLTSDDAHHMTGVELMCDVGDSMIGA